MTTPGDDLDRRLREHYRSLSAPVPDEAVEGARGRVGRRRPRRAPFLLAAASVGAVVLVALAVAGGTFLTPTPGSTRPSISPAATLSPSPMESPSTQPAYRPGQLLRATRSFQLTNDWLVGKGQSLYVVARNRDGSGEVYTIQHWGDLVTGLKPDTVVATVSTTIVDARTEPYVPACPVIVTLVEDVAALQPFERLVCFGAAELTFGPVQREEYPVMAGRPPWLAGVSGVGYLTALPFKVADGIDVPTRRWLRVTGHFNDPGCAGDLTCRERFVVTAAEQTQPPSSELQGTWARMAKSPIAGRASYVAIAIDRGTFIWGGDTPGEGTTGAIYDAKADRWAKVVRAPGGDRTGVAAVWTGEKVLIWGGNDSLADGYAYDPGLDRWSPIPNAPIDGGSGVGAWTGKEFVVVSAKAQAAAWDPAAHAWRRLTDPPLPPGHLESVWTGREMIVLGFAEGVADPLVGAAFDPVTSTWRTIAAVPYDGLTLGSSPRWTGTEMLFVQHGYDPTTDRWRLLKTDGCSLGDVSYGVWTGRWVISQTQAYDPIAGRCQKLPKAPVRPGFDALGELLIHEFHTPFWADRRLVVWSGGTGLDGPGSPPDGVVFVPAPP